MNRSQKDRGGIAVIYALTFMMLVTLVGLSIDIGATFAKRQEAQNAADAAAVAVAAQCLVAKSEKNCAGDYTAARNTALANERADDTATVLDGDIKYDTPKAYHVTVTATATQKAWLLPATTGQNSFTVKRKATVNYGSPTAGTVTIPLTAQTCLFPSTPPPAGSEPLIEVWLPQNSGNAKDAACSGSAFPSGGFGWLDGDNCTAEINIGEVITVNSSTGLPPPNGCNAFGKDYFKNLVAAKTTALIPLFTVSSGSGTGATYTVTRFAVFQLTGFQSQTGTYNDAATTCAGTKPTWASGTCFQGKFLSFIEDPGDFELGGPITELTFTRLVG